MRRGQIPMNKLQWGSQKKIGSILQNKKAKMNSQQELYILQCRSLGAQTRNVQRAVFLELEGIWWLWPLGWINEVQKQSLVSLGGEALKTKTRTKTKGSSLAILSILWGEQPPLPHTLLSWYFLYSYAHKGPSQQWQEVSETMSQNSAFCPFNLTFQGIFSQLHKAN